MLPRFQFTPLREGRLAGLCVAALAGISIHAPPRGATTFRPTARASSTYFNSRPSARGDAAGWYRWQPEEDISIHAPPRGATDGEFTENDVPFYFNSRPSARGDGVRVQRITKIKVNFNSRPSARGDNVDVRDIYITIISIHAPPRGATEQHLHVRRECAISIHAPPRGATRPPAAMCSRS